MLKQQKGITLVALIITIIVMLILAGVSISLVVGDNGVLTQAQDVEPKELVATAKEAVTLANADIMASYYSDTSDTSASNPQKAKAPKDVAKIISIINDSFGKGTLKLAEKNNVGEALSGNTDKLDDTLPTTVNGTIDFILEVPDALLTGKNDANQPYTNFETIEVTVTCKKADGLYSISVK